MLVKKLHLSCFEDHAEVIVAYCSLLGDLVKCLEHLPLQNCVTDSISPLDVLGEQDLAEHLLLEGSEIQPLSSPSLNTSQCLGLV